MTSPRNYVMIAIVFIANNPHPIIMHTKEEDVLLIYPSWK